jgi:hypothetical protein
MPTVERFLLPQKEEITPNDIFELCSIPPVNREALAPLLPEAEILTIISDPEENRQLFLMLRANDGLHFIIAKRDFITEDHCWTEKPCVPEIMETFQRILVSMDHQYPNTEEILDNKWQMRTPPKVISTSQTLIEVECETRGYETTFIDHKRYVID